MDIAVRLMQSKEREKNNHWLGRNVPFYEQRIRLIGGRHIQQGCISTQQHQTLNVQKNKTTILQIDGNSMRSRTIMTNKPPVLQGYKSNKAKLWTVSTSQDTTKEGIQNVYSLPLIQQSIRYLHTAVSYPAKDTWIKAITAGNYRPGLMAVAVRKHFPKSDETQQGHMKHQCQGFRSMKERTGEENRNASTSNKH